MDTIAGLACAGRRLVARQRKAVELALQAVLQATRHSATQTHAHLRQTLVRGGDQGIGVLQHLPLHHPRVRQASAQTHTLQVHGAFQGQPGGQQTGGETAAGVWKVLPPVGVGHPHHVRAVTQVQRPLPFVLPNPGQAGPPGDLIMRQPVQAQCAVVARLQVARLGVQAQTAPGYQPWRQRGVSVGRDVPVVGHGKAHATAAVDLHRRRQPARLALVTQREAQGRHGQDGHTQKAQHRTAGNAFVDAQVQADAVGAQDPIGLLAIFPGAAGVGRVARAGPGIAQKFDAVGPAPSPQLQKLEPWLQEKAFEALHADFQLGARVNRAVTADHHMALGIGQITRCVVGQPVGLDDQAAPAEFHVAFSHGFQIGLAADAARLQHDGQQPGRLGTRQGLQSGAGLQLRGFGQSARSR